MALLTEEGKGDGWVCDKRIAPAGEEQPCSKKRPDLFNDRFSHTIIVEIDENQHFAYDEICENKRLMELYQDLAHRPMVVIRFNPDSYTAVHEGVKRKMKSCFTEDLKPTSELDKRVAVLAQAVRDAWDTVPERALTLERLFFTQ